jgi:hypothetical protein
MINQKNLAIKKLSFMGGMARALDLGSTINFYNNLNSYAQVDLEAVKSDWLMVGKDLENAIVAYRRSSCQNNK